jgi:hypothetical protein
VTTLPALTIAGEDVPFAVFVASCVEAARSADLTARAWQTHAWAAALTDEPLLGGRDAAGALGVAELTLTFHLRLRRVSRFERWLDTFVTWWRQLARLPARPPRSAWKTCPPSHPAAIACTVVARRDAAGWQSHAELPS